MKKNDNTAIALCNEGKAPNTIGDLWKPFEFK